MRRRLQRQAGALMIEILITIAIVVIGVWGLVEVQTQLQRSEMESYQRSQALLLVDDMASRLTSNRSVAGDYPGDAAAVVPPCGTDPSTITPTDPTSLADRDVAEWCYALEGAAETLGGSSVGSLVGGRGCVDDLSKGLYRVTVVWQGQTPISAPPAEIDCGQGQYNLPTGSACAEPGSADTCRRYVTTLVRIATL